VFERITGGNGMSDEASVAKAIHQASVYRAEFKGWVESLSPEKRDKLKRMGLDTPMTEGKGKHNANDVGPVEMDLEPVTTDMAREAYKKRAKAVHQRKKI
jgi:hypothetical protein